MTTNIPGTQDIKDYVAANLDNPQAILGGMIQYGVNADQLSQATGYDRATVDNYFKNAGLYNTDKNYYTGELDPTVKSLVNPYLKTDFYGGYGEGLDPTKFQVGLGNYQTQDIGGGKYNVLGADNSVLGTGYKGLPDAISELGYANAQKQTTQQGNYWTNPLLTQGQQVYRDLATGNDVDTTGYEALEGGAWRKPTGEYNPETGVLYDMVYASPYEKQVARQFGSQSELDEALKEYVKQSKYFGGRIGDWEALGQVLGGAVKPTIQDWGTLPINSVNEKITGEQTLYGSTPIFYDGRLVGYSTDLAPGTDTGTKSWSSGQGNAEWNPMSYQARYNGKSHAWATGLGRDIDPAAYKGLVQRIDGSNVFVPSANAANLPGWTNIEGFKHQDKNYGGWGAGLSKFADSLGPLGSFGGDLSLKNYADNLDKGGLLYATNKKLAAADPLGEAIGKGVSNLFGMDGTYEMVKTVGEPIGNLVGAVFAGGLPIGSLIMGLDAASTGNSAGVQNALKNAAASYAGSVAGGAASGAVGGGAAGNIAGAATNAGVSAAIRGGGLEDVGKAMLAGGLTAGVVGAGAPYIQNYLKDSFNLSDTVSQQASKAITRGLADTIGSVAGGTTLDEALVKGLITGGAGFATSQLKSSVESSLKNAGVYDKVPPRLIDMMVNTAGQYLASQVTGGNIDARKIAAGITSEILKPIAAQRRV